MAGKDTGPKTNCNRELWRKMPFFAENRLKIEHLGHPDPSIDQLPPPAPAAAAL